MNNRNSQRCQLQRFGCSLCGGKWKMVMETDLDLNGKRLLNYNLKSKTVIFGKYDRNPW